MLCLGIESTAHTFGAAIVDNKCNIISENNSAFSTKEGLLPRELAEHHYTVASAVIEDCIKKANICFDDITLISFSQGPGIGNALRVGAIAARMLAIMHDKDILGVNHCVAHIEIGKAKTNAKDPIIIFVSGANTQIIALESNKYRIFGETIDIGVGNLLDSFGRLLNIGFPAGPILDKLYFKGNNYIELPYTVKGSDLAFSGLLTAAKQKIGYVKNEDLIYSLLHTAFAMVTEVAERTLAHTEKNEVLLIGGVAASNAFRLMLKKMCEKRAAKFYVPEQRYCIDNAAMIAWLGMLMYKKGIRMNIADTKIMPKQRTDTINILW